VAVKDQIRVLVAEDEPPLLRAICDLVDIEPELKVVGAATNADEAVEIAAAERPDVAVVDVRMPGGGAMAAQGIRERSPGTRILALSAYDDQATVLEMLRAGVVGYLIKGISPGEVVEAIRRAVRGQASLSIDVITNVIDELARDLAERRQSEEVLKRSEERFRNLVESAPDAVLIADEQGRIVLVNEQTEALFDYPRNELLGSPVETVLPERVRDRHVGHRAAYLKEPTTRPMGVGLDLAGRRRDGSEFPVDISLSAMETEGGKLVTAFVRDITERRRGEMAFRQLAAIVESSEDAIMSKDLNGTILTWNRGAERLYGYRADEVLGRPMSLLVPPNRPDELPAILRRILRGEEIEPIETRRVRKDGSELDVSLKISAIRDVRGAIVGASTIARDITQAKAQAGLERDLAERRALLAHLVTASEEERRRIAEDIHDDSIQAITAAGMRLQILRQSLDDDVQLKLLKDLEETIQLSISRLRHLLFELRPPVLDNEGLSAALEMYLTELKAQAASTTFRLDDALRSQPSEETRVILYRIAQEALTNARKHADAREVTVELREREGGYLVRVVDDGIGFSPDAALPTPGHLGLASMRERATLAGGWLRFDTAPGEGTTMELWIPALASQLAEPGPASSNGNHQPEEQAP
jgi:PAS domain S-box-containing protein